MTNGTKVSLGLAGLVLLAGLALVVVGSRPPPERTFKGTAKDLLPNSEEIPGWTVEFRPIADTPEMKSKIGELLNYDDAVFAVFTSGAQHISVYIAYWTPGKMPHRLVSGHTPDVCWVGAGWETLEAKSGLALPIGTTGPLFPCESRIMRLNSKVEHVVFWHLLDGVPMRYGTQVNAPLYATFTDLFSRKLNQRPEQFFIRISSNEPTTKWIDTALYTSIINRLAILYTKS